MSGISTFGKKDIRVKFAEADDYARRCIRVISQPMTVSEKRALNAQYKLAYLRTVFGVDE